MSAVVRDDWTNCEKNVKHLKNHKDTGFIALVVSEIIEINEFLEENICIIIGYSSSMDLCVGIPKKNYVRPKNNIFRGLYAGYDTYFVEKIHISCILM